jgi:hypothetical protein
MQGIPDSCRSRAWHLILDPKAEGHPSRRTVDSFFSKCVPPSDAEIMRDIPRAMPGVRLFTQSAVRESLYRILRAYANADPEVGYFQGFIFSAALFMSYMTEFRAFWTFYHLMQGREHRLRELYICDFEGLKDLNKVWAYLFNMRLPDVYLKVRSLGIDEMLYTTSWFLTSFLNLGFPPIFRLRIMDRYVAFGTRALLSLGLAIASLLKDELMEANREVALSLLQSPASGKALKEWRDILARWDKMFIPKKEFEAAFRRLDLDIIR